MTNYAKYTISNSGPDKGKVLKDGHTMFILDIVADLNRKSHLEELKETSVNIDTTLLKELRQFISDTQALPQEIETFVTDAIHERAARIGLKSEWLLLSEMIEGPEYWLRDKNNLVGRGYLKDEHTVGFNLDITPMDFGTPILCAVVKPPHI